MNRTTGVNQGWNHAGNIVAALLTMVMVSALGLSSVFYFAGVSSLLAGALVLLIRRADLDEWRAKSVSRDSCAEPSWKALLLDRNIIFLLASIFLFHLVNAPILPTAALYVKKLGGSDNLMAATVLTAQIVMVPVALMTGKLCD